MKHGKRPTAAQRERLKQWTPNPENWLITKDTPDMMEIVHKYSGEVRKIIWRETK